MSYHVRFFAAALIILTSGGLLTAQPTDPEKGNGIARNGDDGTRFIVGFLQNHENTSPCAADGIRSLAFQGLLISSRAGANVDLHLPDGTIRSVVLEPKIFQRIELNGIKYECLGEGICEKSIEILSDQPVVVYGYSSKSSSTDGYLALPVSAWGTEYVVATARSDEYDVDTALSEYYNDCLKERRSGEFAVIASEDSTVVTVVAKERTRAGLPAGTPQTKVLMNGEIWQLQNGEPSTQRDDLTGSRISASKPVGVLTGHVEAGVSWRSGNKSHLIEMIPPISALGSSFLIIPHPGLDSAGYVRVVSVDSVRTSIGTQYEGEVPIVSSLQAYDWRQFRINEAIRVSTSGRALVMYYARSKGRDSLPVTDPFLLTATPIERFARHSLFQTLADRDTAADGRYDEHYVSLLYTRSALSSMRINGSPLADDPRIIAAGGSLRPFDFYGWMTLRLDEGESYEITGDSLFTGYVYGFGVKETNGIASYDSYGWPIASLIDTIGEPPGSAEIVLEGHDFGSVDVGTSICVNLVIRNTGTALLVIDGATFDGDYHFDSTSRPAFPITVAPGDSLFLRVCFTPTLYGTRSGTLTVISNDANDSSVDAVLTGVGVDGSSLVDEAKSTVDAISAELVGRDIVIDLGSDRRLPAVVRLVDLKGAEISCGEIRPLGGRRFSVALAADLTPGIYFIEGDNGTASPFFVCLIVVK